MALRLIEMALKEKDGGEVRELLKGQSVLDHRQVELPDGEVLVRILLDAEKCEAVLDLLENQYAGKEDSRVVILPVEATLPRAEQEPNAALGEPPEEKTPERIGREELYEDIKDAARCSRVYLAMAALSTIVASVGLRQNSVAIIIGAMVIAPLLGPNVASALGTALGDMSLLRRAFLTNLAGIATAMAMALSVMIGVLLHVDPAMPEVAAHTRGTGRHRSGVGVGLCRCAGVHHRRFGDVDRRDGGGSAVAAARDLWAAAR